MTVPPCPAAIVGFTLFRLSMSTGSASLIDASASGDGPGDGSVRVIAAFKIAEALLFGAAAVAALNLLRPEVAAQLQDWLGDLPYNAQQHLTRRALTWLIGMPRGHTVTLATGAFVYSLLFAVEGIGLWLRRQWAEWLTAVATASFVPIELWELVHRPSTIKALIVAINLAVVAYLVHHLRQRRGLAPPPAAAP